MRDGRVAAIGAMLMTDLMRVAAMLRRTGIRVDGTDFQNMLVHMAVMRVMQVTVVQVVHMAVVLNGDVAAVRAVLVGVSLVNNVFAHCDAPVRCVMVVLVRRAEAVAAGMCENILQQGSDMLIR